MIQVEVIKTGEVKTVTPNVAHGLIESGQARLYKRNYKTKPIMPASTHETSGLRSRSRSGKSGYETK